VFLVPVTLIMHDFWTLDEGPQRMEQMINFMKNVSISGGLLMVLALGSGPVSIDSLRPPNLKPAAGP
jgi:putative oxidoreductase